MGTEAEKLDCLRRELGLLADAYGGHLDLFVKVCKGELSPSEQMVYTRATMYIDSVGAQFF